MLVVLTGVLPISVGSGASTAPAGPTAAQLATNGENFLETTGGALCPITALTSKGTSEVFAGVGVEGTSSVTEAETTDAQDPLQVTISQGRNVGLKLGLGILDPPIGGAVGDALLGYTTSSIYAVPTVTEANSLVAFAKDPSSSSLALEKLENSSVQQNYFAGDASIGGAASAFNLAGLSAGLGLEVGVGHDTDGNTELISTLNGNGQANATLGLVGVSGSIKMSLIQDVVFGPKGAVIGVIDKADFDDNGSVNFGKSASDGSDGESSDASDSSEGAMGDGAADFGLNVDSHGSGDIGELAGTLPFSGLTGTMRTEVVNDLKDEADAVGDPEDLISSASDIIRLMGADGLVVYRRDKVDTDTSGVNVNVGLELDFALDFSSTDMSTTLVQAFQVAADGLVSNFAPCSSTIILPIVKKGSLPGIGATMQHWLAAHPADLSNATPVMNPPCAASAGPSCFGGFPGVYGPLTLFGDEFQLVEPASGSACPIPFSASARLPEEESCRVGGMLIVLPHPVDEQAAVVLARSQLPKGNRVTQPPPPADQISGDVQCQTWSNQTLAGLPSLGDGGGAVQVSFISGLSGTSANGSGLRGLLGLIPSGPATYDPNDIYAIGLSADGDQENLC
jgi:hypothetical protein